MRPALRTALPGRGTPTFKEYPMKDLTESSIVKNILQMALPLAAGMVFQTLYFLIDLYFVAGLGDAAIAGVSAAGNVMFIVFAATQVLGVGTVTLISHAAGRKDQADANLVFNQSLALATSCALSTLVLGFVAGPRYIGALGADAATTAAGITYLYWFLPSLALQFALVAMGSALRGTGIVRPAMMVQILTVVLNAILAPVLIAGWGTGHPMGVAGAGLASSLALAAGVLLLGVYFRRLEKYVGFDRTQWRPRTAIWRRLLRVGLPAGGEFLLIFVLTGGAVLDLAPLRSGCSGGLRHRSASHAEHVPARHGGGLCRRTHCRAELRRQKISSGARYFCGRDAYWRLHHGGRDVVCSVGIGLGGACIHQGPDRADRGHSVPESDLVEFPGQRHCVHLLRRLSRSRQHNSGAVELGEPPAELHFAVTVVGLPAALRIDSSSGISRWPASRCRRC